MRCIHGVLGGCQACNEWFAKAFPSKPKPSPLVDPEPLVSDVEYARWCIEQGNSFNEPMGALKAIGCEDPAAAYRAAVAA